VLNGDEAYGISELVLAFVSRIATHPRVFDPPTSLEETLAFVDVVRNQPQCVLIAPGPQHWSIFCRLCRQAGAKGSLVTDAYLAALAIESGSEWITADRDFSRFPGLRWRHPLAP
jgi:toxin-antitoxin system PIN domain toxin